MFDDGRIDKHCSKLLALCSPGVCACSCVHVHAFVSIYVCVWQHFKIDCNLWAEIKDANIFGFCVLRTGTSTDGITQYMPSLFPC